ncbi:hypothetical protein [Stieleria bergensis]|uniref:hypothetical protein n=1 Tax=Stieleria bergensis TaxID=2528025 RepID=UPI003AF3C7F2
MFDEFALDGEGEDGLAEVGEGFGTIVKDLEVVRQASPTAGQLLGVAAARQARQDAPPTAIR